MTVNEWNGLNRGDPVKVRGFRGQWVFRSAEVDEYGVPRSICVIGGSAGHSAFRHFYPEAIIIPKTKRQRKI